MLPGVRYRSRPRLPDGPLVSRVWATCMHWPTPSGPLPMCRTVLQTASFCGDCMEFNLESPLPMPCGRGLPGSAIRAWMRWMPPSSYRRHKRIHQEDLAPPGTRSVKVNQAHIIKAAELSLSDGAIVSNPRLVLDASEVLEIYKIVLRIPGKGAYCRPSLYDSTSPGGNYHGRKYR